MSEQLNGAAIASPSVTDVTRIIEVMQGLESQARRKLLRTVAMFFDLDTPDVMRPNSVADYSLTSREPALEKVSNGEEGFFSRDRTTSPKQFIFSKSPITDVDKMVCLAYYATHYLDTPRFRTLDLSKLNTEAAQTKFSNAAQTIILSVRKNLIAPAPDGTYQITSLGERYVDALPDHGTAKEVIERLSPRRKQKRKSIRKEKVS